MSPASGAPRAESKDDPYEPKMFPGAVLEDQEAVAMAEADPVVISKVPYSSPDPETDGIRMIPLTEQGTGGTVGRPESAATAASDAANLREIEDYDGKSKEDLVALAEERDLNVERTDGKPVEGNVKLRQEDYIAALREDDTKDMKAGDFKKLVAEAQDEEALAKVERLYMDSDAAYSSVEDAIQKRDRELENANE